MHEGHRKRLRESFMEGSAAAFHDHQLLELLLTFSLPRSDTNALAHTLISRYGSLYAVFEADAHDLMNISGVGEHSAALISLVGLLVKRGRGPARAGVRLNTPSSAMDYCRGLFTQDRYETMYLVSLDKYRRVLHADIIGKGSLTEATVYSRIVVECALRHMAHSVILSHNHPSGDPQPSRADIETTAVLLEALTPIGIALHDHIIIAGDKAYSMVRDIDSPLTAPSDGLLMAAERIR